MPEPRDRLGSARNPGSTRVASRDGRQKWIQYPKPNPDARLRLVCLTYSGGRASVFKGLAAGLPDDVEVCAIEFPGHGRRLGETPLTRLEPLVEQVTDVIGEWVRPPFVLLGYSVGALIGLEVAHELARRGLPGPAALFVAAARAPHRRSARPPLHELSRDELIAGLHQLAGVHNDLLDNEELADVMLPVIRADLGLDETYQARLGRLLGCPIAAFGGREDRSVPHADLLSWREHTTGGFSATTLPGAHFFLDSARQRFTEAVAAEIRRLDEERGAGS
ncbi:alpha/beta fold hydrolase [Amycolatopsis sp. NPDC051102]|uniref:thioesterase II family protein n=1 Tax=Amycolatopsis sp. NPDC051102 TaxID=3155163 RepID=UPI0034428E10